MLELHSADDMDNVLDQDMNDMPQKISINPDNTAQLTDHDSIDNDNETACELSSVENYSSSVNDEKNTCLESNDLIDYPKDYFENMDFSKYDQNQISSYKFLSIEQKNALCDDIYGIKSSFLG